MRKHEINLYDHSESNSDKDSKILEVEESSKSKIKTSTIKQKESTIKTKHKLHEKHQKSLRPENSNSRVRNSYENDKYESDEYY